MKVNNIKQVLFYSFILAVPFDNYSIFYQFSTSDLLLISTIVYLIISLFLGKIFLKYTQFYILLIILLFFFILSISNSENLLLSSRMLITSLMIMLITFITIQVANSKKILRNIYWVIIIAGLISAITGIIQWIFYEKWKIILWQPCLYYSSLNNSIILRVTGTYFDPNYYTLYLIVPLIFSLIVVAEKKCFSYKERLFAIISVIIILIPYALSFSRAGWIVLLAFIFCFTFKKIKLWMKIFSLIVIINVVLFSRLITDFIYYLIYFNYESTMQRFNVSISGLRNILEHPITGIGLGIKTFNPYVGYKMETHNTFLQVGTYAGIFALVVYIIIICYICLIGIRNYKMTKCTRDAAIMEGFIWSFGSCVLGMLTLSGVFLKHFWLIAGIIIASHLIIKRGQYEVIKIKDV